MLKEIIIGAVILTGATSAAVAHPAKRGAVNRETAARVAERLELSSAQRAAIRDIHQASRHDDVRLRAEMRRLQRDYRQLRNRNSPRAERLERRMDRVRDAMQARHQRTRARVAAVLTPEQREEARRLGRRN